MTLGSDGATSMAPMDDTVRIESKTGNHVSPALVVFQTPPAGVPAENTPGCPMAPDTAEIRPPRKGPTLRHTRAERRRASMDCARSGVAVSGTAQSTSRDGARIAASDEGDRANVSRQPRVRSQGAPAPARLAIGVTKNSAMFAAPAAALGNVVSPSASAASRNVFSCWYSAAER